MAKNKKIPQVGKPSPLCRFMGITKWFAMFLLFGLAAAEVYVQHMRNMEINWAFAIICVICGILVFWIGHALFAPERQMRRRLKQLERERSKAARRAKA